ncbi:hypothetical protein SAMN05444671_1385 [Flavobacterium sp. CF108]|uniref:HEPN family nuclease n=1 Tax=unclassified Flavobacterium TaxID=196869 RepID=UPI0008C4A73F|nr:MULTISPECIES: HEPN family nuclease [unclassified Flavobacterium]SEO80015.1 hypothetical protein SAMN04487978_3668 [Flavobacterium sp. fv08]SHG75479.1 hypothetical protein SAMN05444671_1385 [Flavobacterium sp. CF108]
MGIQLGQYDRELIKRTIELNKKYKGIYNITLLMNSLLSLIVLPNEKRSFRNIQFLKSSIYSIPEIQNIISQAGFIFDSGFYKQTINGVKTNTQNPRDLENLLRRIRNGISHQRIEPISDINNKWIGVIIQDYSSNNVCGLNVHFTISELKSFALFIGNSYLNELPE